MTKYQIFSIAAALSYVLLAGCSKKQAEEIKPIPTAPGDPGAQVTYTGFVQPLFQTKCAGCHGPGKQYAQIWSFNGYSSVTSNADRIKNAVLVTKSMPQGGSLTAAELQSLKDWFDQGMKQ